MLKKFSLFFIFLLFSHYLQADLFAKKNSFLTAKEAFIFSAEQQNNNLALHWQIADGYYLYQKEISVKSKNIELGELKFPPAERYQDEFFGEVDIFRHQLSLNLPILSHSKGELEIHYQGCTKGFCYPPEKVVLDLQAVDFTAQNTNENSAPSAPSATQFADKLMENAFSVWGFFLLGIALAFTPCVLPMLPLLSAVVIGHQTRPNLVRAFLLSFSYVQGMALTYTLLGIAIVSIGLPFQIALQSPPVLIALSLLFMLLAASMFGLFELRLPNSWQQKLNNLSLRQQGGSVSGVFIMGVIAGLVASPCTSAPLSGVLLYVAQSGDLWLGGLALYLLALGMGLPLMLVTLFGNKILPKSGDWLLKVKTLFGFAMLSLPIFLLSRILPAAAEPLMWSALAMSVLGWLLFTLSSRVVIRIFLLMLFALAAYPWGKLIWEKSPETTVTTPHFQFERIHSLAELEDKLSHSQGKQVMLDLYADWCVACKEFEKYTFSDPVVQQKLAKMLVLQIDMTGNSAENEALMQHFQILGLPTILFFNAQGEEIKKARITGFLDAAQFNNWLDNL